MQREWRRACAHPRNGGRRKIFFLEERCPTERRLGSASEPEGSETAEPQRKKRKPKTSPLCVRSPFFSFPTGKRDCDHRHTLCILCILDIIDDVCFVCVSCVLGVWFFRRTTTHTFREAGHFCRSGMQGFLGSGAENGIYPPICLTHPFSSLGGGYMQGKVFSENGIFFLPAMVE